MVLVAVVVVTNSISISSIVVVVDCSSGTVVDIHVAEEEAVVIINN